MWNFLLFCYNTGCWVWAYVACKPYLKGEASIAIVLAGLTCLCYQIKFRALPPASKAGRFIGRSLNICFTILLPAGLLFYFNRGIDQDLTGGTTPAEVRNAYLALWTLMLSSLLFEIMRLRQPRSEPQAVKNS